MMPKKGTGHQLKGTLEYNSWVNMRQRCNNAARHDAFYYDGIGICSDWDDVVRFVTDMGPRPSVNHQIDRIDNTRGYSKENCRWVDRVTQMRNTRISKWWYVYGVRYGSLSEASAAHGVSPPRIKAWCDGRDDGNYTYPPNVGCWSEMKYE